MRNLSRMRSRIAAISTICVLLVLSAGCQKAEPNRVKGKVSAKGKNLVWGTVTLVDSKGQYYQGTINLDGDYSIENVPPGPVKIGVVSDDPGGRDGGGNTGAAGGRVGAAGGAQDPRTARGFTQDTRSVQPLPPPGAWFPINRKYSDPNSSGLTDEVKPGKECVLNIELKE